MVLLGMMACFAQVKQEQEEGNLVGDTAPLFDTGFESDTNEDETDSAVEQPTDFDLEITGNYTDMLENRHNISDEFWIMGIEEDGEYLYHIRQIYNSSRFLIARNDNLNGGEEGGLWSRFDWIWDAQNNLWFCQTTYLAASEEEAFETKPPSVNDLSLSGCEGYGWLKLDPE